MCGKEKEIQCVNPGNLGPNTEICQDYIPKLLAQYGYKEPGFKVIDDETIEIFSETTGWEKIKTYWVKEFFGNVFVNELFPVSVYLEHEEIKTAGRSEFDHHTFGVTWACARDLAARTDIPIPDIRAAPL